MTSPLVDIHSGRAQGMEIRPTWSLPASDSVSTGLRQEWRRLLAAAEDPFMIYQSPEWFDFTAEAAGDGPDAPCLATRRDANRGLVGVVPLYPVVEPCEFRLAHRWVYRTRPKPMVQIPSGRLLLPPGDSWLDGLFASMARRGAGGRILKISNVPIPSPLHHYIATSDSLRRGYFIFTVPGLSRIQTVPLTSTYEEFLAKYSSKKRYNIRRQLRQMEQYAKGGLKLRRFESEEGVTEFHRHWDRMLLSTGAPPPSPAIIEERERTRRGLARHGLFCSYVLMDGERPVAGFLGRRYDPVYMLDITRHDREYEAFSPGSCLLHMVVEQLIGGGTTRLINLGYGDPNHEYRATNLILEHTSYWLVPRTWKTRAFQAGYTMLRRGLTAVKAVVPYRPRPVASSRDEPRD